MNVFARIALATLVTASVATPVAAQDDPPYDAPGVASVDQNGAPLRGMIFGGTSSSKWDDIGWQTQSFSAYEWVKMTDVAFTDGPTADIRMIGSGSVDCTKTVHRMTFRERVAPRGYDRILGVLTLCLTRTGWIVGSNTTGGRISYNATKNRVVFHHRKRAVASQPATQPSAPPRGVLGDSGSLPATGASTSWQALIAATLTATGAAAMAASRRRRVNAS